LVGFTLSFRWDFFSKTAPEVSKRKKLRVTEAGFTRPDALLVGQPTALKLRR